MTQQQRLIYDSSLNSTALRLYVAVVGFQVEQQEGKNDEVYPQLIINSETTLLGATTIAQYIDRQVSASVVTRATTLESCQMLQWISFAQRDLSNTKMLSFYLNVLNKAISSSSYISGNTLSLGDIFLYVALHKLVQSDYVQVSKFSSVLRWFDFIQNDSRIVESGLFQKLSISFVQKNFVYKSLIPVVEPTKTVDQQQPQQPQQQQQNKGGDQKAKQPQAQAQQQQAQQEEVINPSILDLRIGRVLSVKKHEKADKLLVEEIDVGEEQPRTICSGLVGKIAIEDILGKDVLVMCNLKPSNMVGVASNGMVVCSTNKTTQEVELVKIPENTYKVGERVNIEGFDGKPAPPNQMSKKLGKILPLLSTNDQGQVVFNGTALFKTSGGGILFSKFTGAEVK